MRLARGIVTGDILVADGSQEWVSSLLLMAAGGAFDRVPNLGLVLVPVGPHLGSYWINGRVPAVTHRCEMVAKGQIDELQAIVDEMNAALHPERGDRK